MLKQDILKTGFFSEFIYCIILCLSFLLGYVLVYDLLVWCPLRSEEGVEFPRIRVNRCCELPMWVMELNFGPLQEQQVCLVVESTLQALKQGISSHQSVKHQNTQIHCCVNGPPDCAMYNITITHRPCLHLIL